MSKAISAYWQYIGKDCGLLPDPRISVVRHMGWQLPVNISLYSGAEPDNYNFAVFDHRPHDFKFIQHQCWYKIDHVFKRKKVLGWIGLYIAEERLQSILFNREILKIQPEAVWRYDKARLIRPKRTELQRERFHYKSKDGNLTTEERLYQLGYYENLQRKYFDGDERFIKVVGQPRGFVLDSYPEDMDQNDGL